MSSFSLTDACRLTDVCGPATVERAQHARFASGPCFFQSGCLLSENPAIIGMNGGCRSQAVPGVPARFPGLVCPTAQC